MADIKKLSSRDRVSTTAHLTQTIKNNARHVLAHAKETVKQAGHPDRAASTKFNATHAARHAKEVFAHADKLAKHLTKYPSAKAAMKELMNPTSSKPTPPSRGG